MSHKITIDAQPAQAYEIPDDIWNFGVVELDWDVEAFTNWLTESRSPSLGGITPVEMLKEENGAIRIMQVLGAIAYGVYL